MKRRIKTYRQVLLDAESADGELRYSESDDPAEVYHARLLAETLHIQLVDGMDEVVITRLVGRGHDLVDLLRDGQLVEEVQAELAAKGLDEDHLEAALVLLREKLSLRLVGEPPADVVAEEDSL